MRIFAEDCAIVLARTVVLILLVKFCKLNTFRRVTATGLVIRQMKFYEKFYNA